MVILKTSVSLLITSEKLDMGGSLWLHWIKSSQSVFPKQIVTAIQATIFGNNIDVFKVGHPCFS